MAYKLVFIEINPLNNSFEIIKNEIVDSGYKIDDIKDFILLRCKEINIPSPNILISKINEIEEISFLAFINRNYNKDKLIKIVEDYFNTPDFYEVRICLKK